MTEFGAMQRVIEQSFGYGMMQPNRVKVMQFQILCAPIAEL